MKRLDSLSADYRAVSETVGVVFLLGMIVIGTSALAVTGADMISGLEEQAERDQARNAFSKLSSSTTSVALGDDTSRAEVDLGLGQPNGDTKQIGVQNSGTLRIYINNTSAGTRNKIVEEQLGELRYRNENVQEGNPPVQLGMQNGGVWSGEPNSSALESPPEAHYQSATLTLPLISVSGPENIQSDEVVIKKSQTRFPTDHVEITDDEIVELEVQSPYYKAWYEYFKNRLPGRLDAEKFPSNNTTRVRLGFNDVFPQTFSNALTGTGSVSANNGNPTINGNIATTGQCDGCSSAVQGGSVEENYEFDGESMDSIVNSKILAYKQNETHITLSGGETITEGKYYTSEMKPNSQVTFDVSDGNITLAIDGDTFIDDRVEIVGTSDSDSGQLKVFTNGDYEVVTGDGEVVIDGSNKTYNQVYGTSSSNLRVNQKGTFEGLWYAPSNSATSGTSGSPGGGNGNGGGGGPGGAACGDVSVCIGQNTEVTGAIVGGTMEVGQGANVTYTNEFQTFEPEIDLEDSFRARIVYLHVSVNEVTIEERD